MLYDYIKKDTDRGRRAVAVKDSNGTLSYSSLDEKSTRLANLLNHSGVGKGDRIGLMCKKSVESIIAIYGIMKSGAAYVPIDINGPVDRSGFIIKDCGIKLVLADKSGLDLIAANRSSYPGISCVIYWGGARERALNGNHPFRLIPFEDALNASSKPGRENCRQDDLAYILYTSGSTGNPKGVMLTHRNGAAFVDWAIDYLNLDGSDVFSSHAPFTFDLSIFDIFGAHRAGGILCLPPEGMSFFPESVIKYIRENAISVWYSVPSALIQLIEYIPTLQDDLRSVQTLIFAGEVFSFNYLSRLTEAFSGRQLINFYGPTETNVITYYSVDFPARLTQNIPIGKPCPYAETAIIDEAGNRTINGEKGELIVRGESLMAGYWNNAERTENVIKPVSVNRGGPEASGIKRYYHTGDVVFNKDGSTLEYVGRKDRMIKTRGFRVELDDIETVLSRCDGVEIVTVITKPDRKISNRLYAFVVMKQGRDFHTDDLREYADEALPVYMIPETFFKIDSLPLTANGKIDQRTLAEMIN